MKPCSRPGCHERAVVQLTYSYASSEVEMAPVEDTAEPGSYALCQSHIDRFKLPKGWRLIRSGAVTAVPLSPAEVDALAEKIRRVGLGSANDEPEGTEFSLSRRTNLVTLTSRAHLRVVTDVANRQD